MKLFDFSFPNPEICNETELYYRATSPLLHQKNKLLIPKNTTVSFDTYFNAFPLVKYREYTTVQNLYLSLIFSGKANLSVWTITSQNIPRKIAEYYNDTLLPKSIQVGLPSNLFCEDDCIIYLKVETFSFCEWKAAFFGCLEDPGYRITAAVVMCTYRRKEEILRNLNQFQQQLSQTPEYRPDFFIIDNGQNLSLQNYPDLNVHLIPNCNHGGSGGFSRGLQEIRQAQKYSHVFLMDDDITVDALSFQKIYSILSLLKPAYQHLCIGGSMLYRNEPFRQFEAGGFFCDHQQKSYGHFWDLREQDKVLANEQLHPIHYNGWWFACFSLAGIKNTLPLPFFLKFDDVEFALRCQLPMITLNGVCVWHELFEKKYSFITEYYNTRNYWITHTLHSSPLPRRKLIQSIFKDLNQKLVRQQYLASNFILQGYQDFLKGPSFLKNTNPELLHQKLAAQNLPFLSEQALKQQYQVIFHPDNYQHGICAQKSQLKYRLNRYGISSPKCFFPKDPLGYRVIDAFYNQEEMYYQANKILHFNSFNKTGYVTQLSRGTEWKLRFKMFRLSFYAFFRYQKIQKAYREHFQEICSEKFWTELNSIK